MTLIYVRHLNFCYGYYDWRAATRMIDNMDQTELESTLIETSQSYDITIN